ncbi:PDZ domain (Also known as DHR or GLGF) [Planctomycetales bacterium 10988]|nr:PDZ domain (Also known as DHR or GLGF) [Planctomycetales bacterium 10988]
MVESGSESNRSIFTKHHFFALVTCSLLLASAVAAEEHERLLWKRQWMEISSTVENGELLDHVSTLASDAMEGRAAGSRGGRAAGNYIAKEFAEFGLEPAGDAGTYFQSFPSNYRNILGLLPGSDPELRHEIIVVGAHYDHVGYGTKSTSYGPLGYIHNGADDNASGTAAVLEAAEALTKLSPGPRRSILFALWDNEENGLYGSKHWLKYPQASPKEVVLAFNLDMVGRLRKETVEVYGSQTGVGIRHLLTMANETVGLNLDFSWEMTENSDHYPFFAKDIPIIMFHTGLHDDYHRPSDDVERINTEGVQSITQLLLASLLLAADQEERISFRPKAHQETLSEQQRRRNEPLPLIRPRLGITWAHIPEEKGIRVLKVIGDSAAEEAGLQPEDRLLSLAGVPLNEESDFTRLLLAAPKKIAFEVLSEGEENPRTVDVQLGGNAIRAGIIWREDSASPGSVFVRGVVPGSAAAGSGLHKEDRIFAVNGQPFTDSASFRKLLQEETSPLTLKLERKGRLQTARMEMVSFDE